ncbi:MAG: exo-alpha-sialidase [Planctomycetaceae bacterium]|nr:exo-alpha-sialidase [Planctomycetaceae bacterium]
MSDRLFVATEKGLFDLRREPGGPDWKIARVSFLGDDVSMVLPDRRDGTLYAGLALGHFGVKLRRSTDDGATWQDCGLPEYPPQTETELGEAVFKPGQTAAKLEYIWSLEAADPARPGSLWCGTLPGGLFRSDDAGTTWSLVRTLWDDPLRKKWFGGGMDRPGIHSICVDPRDCRHVTLGVSCGGVWVTRDAGETWQCKAQGMWAAYMPPEAKDDPNIQDPHRVVQCAGYPDAFWAQHHNGTFRSTDGSESWHDVGTPERPSSFGFAVAVHPHKADTAWFVPAVKDECRVPSEGRFVVTRTRDGGKSFEMLDKGLPAAAAYDVVFRHGLDIDETGDRLAMGSTTGGLWVSDDQGDHWQCVSEHLPQILCVRFG